MKIDAAPAADPDLLGIAASGVRKHRTRCFISCTGIYICRKSGGHKIDSWYSERVCPTCFDELTAWASYSKRLAWAIRFFRLAERVVISKEQSGWRREHRPGRVFSKTDLLRECISKIIKPNTLATLRRIDHKPATKYLIDVAKTVAVDLYEINERENRYLLDVG